MLAVKVEAYEPHASSTDVDIKVRFDAKGGPPADWYVYIGLGSLGNGINWYCGRTIWTKRYRVRVREETMTRLIPSGISALRSPSGSRYLRRSSAAP